jgi:hypothetical protein
VPVLDETPLEGPVSVNVVIFEVPLTVVLAETKVGEAVLLYDDDVVGNDVTILVPLALTEMLDEAVELNDEVGVVRLVPLKLVTTLVEVELSPLEIPVLSETVLLEDVAGTLDVIDKLDVMDELEEVVATVGSVAVEALTDLDEDEDDIVKVLDRGWRVDVEINPVEEDEREVDPLEEVECDVDLLEEVECEEDRLEEDRLEEVECEEDLLEEVECEVDMLEEAECEELLAVDEVLPRVEDELDVTVLPSMQSQSPVRYAALYFWKGDEVLALIMVLVFIVRLLSCYWLWAVEVTEIVWLGELASKLCSALPSGRSGRDWARGGSSSGAAIARLGIKTVADSGDIWSGHLDERRGITVSVIESDARTSKCIPRCYLTRRATTGKSILGAWRPGGTSVCWLGYIHRLASPLLSQRVRGKLRPQEWAQRRKERRLKPWGISWLRIDSECGLVGCWRWCWD